MSLYQLNMLGTPIRTFNVVEGITDNNGVFGQQPDRLRLDFGTNLFLRSRVRKDLVPVAGLPIQDLVFGNEVNGKLFRRLQKLFQL